MGPNAPKKHEGLTLAFLKKNFVIRIRLATFGPRINNKITMGHHEHEHHEVHEAEQNEIGAPVVFALVCLALAILTIYFIGAGR